MDNELEKVFREVRTKYFPKPKPVVEPPILNFDNVIPGEIRKGSFIIRNSGGPFNKVEIQPSSPWIKINNIKHGSPKIKSPIKVDIGIQVKNFRKRYQGVIKVKLDDSEISIRVQLQALRMPTEIVYFNLPGPTEPTPEMRGGELLHGFLTGLYNESNNEIKSYLDNLCIRWNIRYRDNREGSTGVTKNEDWILANKKYNKLPGELEN